MGGVCCGPSTTAEPNSTDAAQPTQPQASRSKPYEVPQQQGLHFGYQSDFSELYEVGSELGKGQYGTTYVYAPCYIKFGPGACLRESLLKDRCLSCTASFLVWCSCIEKRTRKEYAVKKVSKATLNDKQAIDDLVREVKILTVLKGKPNIVEFFGSYEDQSNVYMVLECAPPPPHAGEHVTVMCVGTCSRCCDQDH